MNVDPDTPRNWEELFKALHHLGAISQQRGDEAAARIYSERALETARGVVGTPRESIDLLLIYAGFLGISAYPPDLLDPVEALEVCERVAQMTDHQDPRTLRTLGRLHHAAGQDELAVQTPGRALRLPMPAESPLRKSIARFLASYRGDIVSEDGTSAMDGE